MEDQQHQSIEAQRQEGAWKLFSYIADKDPASVATRDEAVATFRACLDAVSHKSKD